MECFSQHNASISFFSNGRAHSNLHRSRSTRSFAEITGSFFRSTCNGISRFFSKQHSKRKRKRTSVSPEVNGETFQRSRRQRTNHYEMESLENNELELAVEAQTLNDEKTDDVEEGLDAARITISNSTKDDQIQVNEISSTTTTVIDELFMDFPFFVDDDTIKWIRSNRVMFIMRGLPGSGKSTLVKTIQSIYAEDATGDFCICSADDFFMSEGCYRFDASRLSDAHEDCQSRMKEALTSRTRTVVIDNTNVMYWEMKPYIQFADQEGYFVILVEPKTPWRLNAEVLANKNTHSVPKEALEKKIKVFKPIVPFYYAWFLSSYDGNRLMDVSKNLLKLCLETCDKFQSDFQEFSDQLDLSSQVNYYARKQDENTQISSKLHCTANFCGRARKGKYSESVIRYASNPEVSASLGLLSRLSVIGFVMTKSSFGARVRLSDIQLELYNQNDEEFKGINGLSSEPTANSSFEYVGSEQRRNLENMGKIEKIADFSPVSGKGRRAHITLGTAKGVSPVQTGFDLLEAVSFEQNASKEKLYYNIFTFQIPETKYVLRRYRNDLWVLYTASKDMLYDAIFTANYT